MTLVRVCAVALNQTPLDWVNNEQNIRNALNEARADGASVVCLPELCIPGYGCEDAFLWPATRHGSRAVLEALLPETRGLFVSVGLPLKVDGEIFNAVAVLVDGEIAGFVCKRHLAGDGLHYEPRWFSPWPAGLQKRIEILGRDVPVGDLLFEVSGVRIGFEICEDAWVPNRPAGELGRAGAGLILCPSASHFAFDKHLKRRELALQGARDSGAAYAYCNLLGNEAGRAIYDGDCLIVSQEKGDQKFAAEARRLSFNQFNLACATLDLESGRGSAGLMQAVAFVEDAPREVVHVPFKLPQAKSKAPRTQLTPREDEEGRLPKEDSFARAVGLGLFDYLRKSASRGFVVSLSGGADSAAVATLVRLMVRFACKELGLAGCLERLSQVLPEDASGWSEEQLARHLLVTVYQGTKNSSDITKNAAAGVAQSLGAEHHVIDVDGLVNDYRALTQKMLGRELSWETDDVALQNIQARVRAPSVWMLANVRGALLLSTSNRSEAAVGYATMDGDTCGGLAPIAGIDKAFLRRWLVYLESTGLPEWGPMPALKAVNEQQPTAELRPPSATQTDEEDLMPYEVLDLIERAAVVRRFPPEVVQKMVAQQFAVSQEQALFWIDRFYTLFTRNQWKRERYAPSFHLDEGNLDPRTWCRFPILSGGFRKELSLLGVSPSPRSFGSKFLTTSPDYRLR